jgi:hypothetical protein
MTADEAYESISKRVTCMRREYAYVTVEEAVALLSGDWAIVEDSRSVPRTEDREVILVMGLPIMMKTTILLPKETK